jgi:hypothetical protein
VPPMGRRKELPEHAFDVGTGCHWRSTAQFQHVWCRAPAGGSAGSSASSARPVPWFKMRARANTCGRMIGTLLPSGATVDLALRGDETWSRTQSDQQLPERLPRPRPSPRSGEGVGQPSCEILADEFYACSGQGTPG